MNIPAPLRAADAQSQPDAVPAQDHHAAERRASLVLLSWSLLYALLHLYWGLGGTAGRFALKPSVPEEDIWEVANLFAFGLMAFAGLLGLGLEASRKRPAPRLALLTIVAAGAAIAGSHGLFGMLYRASQVAGITRVDGQAFDTATHEWVLWDMLAIEPWFLVEGLLLAFVGYIAQRSAAGRSFWLRSLSAAFALAFATGILGLKVG